MSDYPVMMRLAGRRCVVVGAGQVGRRKARSLRAAGADPVLIDPDLSPSDAPEGVELISRPFAESDLENAFLVFAATGDAVTNQSIAAAARERSILVTIADDPDASDFTLPATFRRGRLSVAVATSGASPAVASMVRDDLAKVLAPEWEIFLELARILRSRLLTSNSKSAYNQQVLQNLVSAGFLQLIQDGDVAGMDRLLEMEFGKGHSLADLGVSLPKGLS